MDKSFLKAVPESHAAYIALAEDVSLETAFENSLKQLREINVGALESIGKATYAPGKWTIHDILQHLTDTERIFDYRALRFARKDPTVLTGYNQDEYAKYARANDRTIADLLDEYREVHQGSARLFSTFDKEMLLRTGSYAGNTMSVLAIGYIILGHKTHHFKIMEEKYGVAW